MSLAEAPCLRRITPRHQRPKHDALLRRQRPA